MEKLKKGEGIVYEGANVRRCREGEPINPILKSTGKEIDFEKYGISCYIWKTEAKGKDGPEEVYQCPLVTSEKPGSGNFDEFLKDLKDFVSSYLDSRLAFTSITNQGIYKHLMKNDIPVIKDGLICSIIKDK